MRAVLLPLLLLAAPVAAETVQPRPVAQVDGAMVRLADLFEGAGARGATVLGPAPAPGQSLTVEAAQLDAIARRYGLAWRAESGAARVLLERPGRAIAQEEVAGLLRSALRRPLDEEEDVEFFGYVAPLVPAAGFARLALDGAALDAGSRRFAATLVVMAEDMPTLRLRIAGRLVATAPMLVAARRVAIGEVLGPQDVRMIRVPASRLRPGAAQRVEQAVGQAVRRPAADGQPLLIADFGQPVAVQKGASVTMLYEAPGMALAAQGRALEAGARGAVVPVMNIGSRIVVEAQVVAPGRVRVGPGR